MSVGEPSLKRWTRKAYYNAASAGAFDGERVELIDGEIVVMSPMDARHATAIRLVQTALDRLQSRGFVMSVQLPLILGEEHEPEPDVYLTAGEAKDFNTEHPRSAELLVEVSNSTLHYDRTKKRALYAAHAIPEYWIVNLVDEQIEVHRDPVDGDYDDVSIYLRDSMVGPLIDPTFQISVVDLLP